MAKKMKIVRKHQRLQTSPARHRCDVRCRQNEWRFRAATCIGDIRRSRKGLAMSAVRKPFLQALTGMACEQLSCLVSPLFSLVCRFVEHRY